MPPALLLPPPQNVWKELPAPDLPQREACILIYKTSCNSYKYTSLMDGN